jgi:D-alanyl-D-alanine dipeptidase
LLYPQLWRVFACLAIAACIMAAQDLPAAEPYTDSGDQSVQPVPDLPASWFERLWHAPLSWFMPEPLELAFFTPAAPEVPPCMIEPLPQIDDPHAQSFESQVGYGSVVNLDGLTEGASRGLARFASMVESAGGRLQLTSAYRPAPYQAHLQAVWDKWMVELRNNVAPECETLRAEVQGEFDRHQLLETQRPVSFSDHTRGIGVDAAVMLPRRARLGRVRVGIDRLARMAGFRRPDIGRDPVHFRFVAHL